MKRITQKLMFALVLSVASIPAFAQFATPTNFTPVSMSEEAPMRFFVNLNSAMLFKNAITGSNPNGQFDIMNGQLNLGLIYNVGMGLDIGLGIHGGVFAPNGVFRSVSAGTTQYGMMLGADIMVRYLAMFSDVFYGGIQAQVGYNYTDFNPGVTYPNSSVTSFIPVVAGVILGVDFKDAVAFYVFPALEMGQTPKADGTDTGIWKSALGWQVAVGTAINLAGTKLVLEVKPRMADFNNSNLFGMDATLGAFWDF